MWFWVIVLYLVAVFAILNSKYIVSLIDLKRRIDLSKKVPGPDFLELVKNSKKERILPWLHNVRKQYGPLFRVWFGKDLFVFVSSPEDVRAILSNNQLLYKSKNYQMLQPWLGKGLLTNGGEEWHKRRKLLTPAFHFKTLSAFKQPMEQNCRILIGKLNKVADGVTSFDIYPYITLFALDVICETAMGVEENAQNDDQSDYVKAVQEMCQIAHKQSFSVWQRISILFNLSKAGRKRNRLLKILHGETNRVIKLRRQMLEKEGINDFADNDNEDIEMKRRLAFLDMLLIAQKSGAPLSDRQIREEVDTFMFEGHDTTSSTLSFAIYLISKHPIVQQNVYEEALAYEGRENEPMHYMEAWIKETLRLYPAVPFFSRILHEDIQLRDLTIPVGTTVSVLAYVLHRDSDEFPDPEKFKPERFFKTQANDLHPFAYVPFSAGPRNCIGQKFAMLELKCTLANLLRHFEILPEEGFEVVPLAELVMKSGSGIQVKLKKRVS